MKEIVNLQIGKCGNNIGTQFWELLCIEHGLDPMGSYKGVRSDFQLRQIGNYFMEVRGMRYVPRSIMIDLDRESLDSVKSSPYYSIFRSDNFVHGQGGTGNNWAKGHYTEGMQLKEAILDVTRREAENTDCLQGFQIVHAIGGGTGSGLGSLIMSHLRDEYPGRIVSTFTVIPSPDDPKSGTEIYNGVLSLSHLIFHSDESYAIDNLALHHICSENPKFAQYQMVDLNHLISSVMSGITTSMRFNGHCNTNFRKIAVNYVPYPRMHFFVSALAPLKLRSEFRQRSPPVQELMNSVIHPKKLFVECDAKYGKFLTVAMFVRGSVCLKDVVNKLDEIQNKSSSRFVNWVPDNAKAFVYEIPPTVVNTSATMITNTAAIQNFFKRLKDQFSGMFKRKAFLTPLTNEGMDVMELEEAVSNLQDLMDEYVQTDVSNT